MLLGLKELSHILALSFNVNGKSFNLISSLQKMHEVQAIAETSVQVKSCPICQSYEHLMEECPTIPAVREMFGDQANVIGQFRPNNNAPYGNTYNSS